MLLNLSIQHYKGFYDNQDIEFARPDSAKPGSGLTLIVGPNNTGKTTIIESLLLDNKKKLKESERHKDNQPVIIIEGTKGKSIFSNIDNGSQISLIDESNIHEIKFEVAQSRRQWNHVSPNDWDGQTFLDQTANHETRNAGGLDTAARLKTINQNNEQKQKLINIIQKIIPHFTSWTIDTNDQGDYVKYITANSEHQANLLGDGIISIFRICAHLVSEDKNRVLIIDEPELSLHPTAQKALSKIITEASRDKQVILCTHSPYFVNWQDLINGAKFIRLNKVEDKKCTVSSLESKKNYASFIGSNFLEWQKPQLLDLVAKEILFTERMLFVEGQEDVGLIRKWSSEIEKEISFDIFGYGVGSYSNIRLFLEMSRDLGLEKVAALYDSGNDAEKSIESDKQEFPDYCLEQLPTQDIRDKYLECKKCKTKELIKEGCFDESGVLKSGKKDEFESTMKNIFDYFRK